MTDPRRNPIVAVVDDDRRILESLQNLLESADYDVRTFSCAKALVESPYLSEIDCLISDIDMPAMDGFELLRTMRAARPELPIILITGHPGLLTRSPPADRDFPVFNKPFDGEKLLA